MSVRVIRLMEYTYPDLGAAAVDMARWAVQGSRSFDQRTVVRSTVITPYPVPDEPEAAPQPLVPPRHKYVNNRGALLSCDVCGLTPGSAVHDQNLTQP